MKLKEKVDHKVSQNQLAELYVQMIKNGDETSAEKILDLYEKQSNNEFVISFAGHFSAGKSSLLNYTLDKDVLPKSPIPTSANIVKITSGEGVARIYFNNETTVQYDEPYDIDMIKDYCMDRDTIKQIEINTSEQILPEHSYLVDTPGIDAADDADRLMTESSLHIIDRLFYVMDYNHVQSEVNLYFLQEMQRQNIPFFIVINQIDKHNEEEIPFSQFTDRVKQTFEQWHIEPENIFYTSAKNEDVKHNELTELKLFIFDLLNKKERTTEQIQYATTSVIKQHEQFLIDQYDAQLIDTDDNEARNNYQDLQEELIKLKSFSTNLQNTFSEEINLTLNNAYLMPAQLRDLAEQFLQSQQRDFKVGGFFRVKKRTEDEKQVRMNTFSTELQKTIESTIQWRLRDKLSEMLREQDIHEEQLFESIQNIVVNYQDEDILRLVNPGATVNGNYVLNYTNEISADIKNKFRQETNDLWKKVETIINEDSNAKINDLTKQIHELRDSLEKQEKNVELKNELNNKKIHINDIIESDITDEQSVTTIQEAMIERKKVVIEDVPIISEQTKETDVVLTDYDVEEDVTGEQPSLNQVITAIDRVVDSVTNLHGFDTIVADLQEKKSRLNNRELTIALFGAFSAGKSSFSNALFGEQILPVSPNPTTAVINRISPVTDEHKHGTVIITLKDEDMLTSDINGMLRELNITDDDFHQLMKKIKDNKVHEHESLNNMYQAYLQALIEGYGLQKDNIGTKITISLDAFADYVTDESKACYIEAVDLYYDCEVTRRGITIVDTPGADSINARHTNVAFDYIKYADAILYVTYYNHAITRADRDFLMQLGRVKESFELDKMFFIVNAADLAEDKAELDLVLNYVKDQLLQFGIRFPNVFPISSKQSIEEKLANEPLNDMMTQFEEQFYSFIEKDLAKLTIQSAVWDMNRAHKMLLNYLKTINLDKQQQETLKNELTEKQANIKRIINDVNTDRLKEQLRERIKRQLHYVNERLYIRFHDMFSDHYNPTTVTQSGQRGMEQIRRNRTELVDYVGYELLQELRAVSLRIEAFINTILSQFHKQIEDDVNKVDHTFILANYVNQKLDTPNYEQAFTQLDNDVFTPALRLFRGTKAFFEQNERDKMKEAFYDILKPFAEKYVSENEHIMSNHYDSQITDLTDQTKEKILTDIETIIDNQLTLLTDAIEVDVLQHKETEVSDVIKMLQK